MLLFLSAHHQNCHKNKQIVVLISLSSSHSLTGRVEVNFNGWWWHMVGFLCFLSPKLMVNHVRMCFSLHDCDCAFSWSIWEGALHPPHVTQPAKILQEVALNLSLGTQSFICTTTPSNSSRLNPAEQSVPSYEVKRTSFQQSTCCTVTKLT